MVFAGDIGASTSSGLGAQLAATCASCHRLDGQETVLASIVGVDEQALARMLLAFKSGERSGQIMSVVSHSLSDDEIATVARYLSTLRVETKQP